MHFFNYRTQSLTKLKEVSTDSETLALAAALKGKKLEDQIDEIMKQVLWTEDFTKKSMEMIEEDLKVVLAKTASKITPKVFGSLMTKTGMK